jgi:ribose transport system substrate-binding protein
MSASAIRLARLLGQNKGMGDLTEQAIPASVTLFSPVVTKDNVDQYLPFSFE